MDSSRPSDDAIRAATGRGWEEWHALLARIGAADLPHKEIAARLTSDHGVPGWWSQTITVDFERAIGRRAVGQRCDGEFSGGATKTLPGTVDAALAAWERLVADRREFDGVAIAGAPRISRTDRWRYWRVDFADGSRLEVAIGAKPGTTPKAGVAVSHLGLATRDAAEHWKAFWKSLLSGLGRG